MNNKLSLLSIIISILALLISFTRKNNSVDEFQNDEIENLIENFNIKSENDKRNFDNMIKAIEALHEYNVRNDKKI